MKRLPLRLQMTLLYTLVTALSFVIFIFSLYWVIQAALLEDQKALLQMTYSQVVAHIENEDGQMVVDEREIRLTTNASYRVWDHTSTSLSAAQLPSGLDTPPTSSEGIQRIWTDGATWLWMDAQTTVESHVFWVRVTVSLAAVDHTLGILRSISLVAGPLLLLLSAFSGLTIARRSLRPIDRIIATAREVAQGDLSRRIQDTAAQDEVGQLTQVLNHMLTRLEASFQREKRFASDASHELRTPVSIIMAYAETLALETCPEETVKNAQVILAESRRMQRVIAQLLTITRGDEGKYIMERVPVDLREIALTVLEQMEALAQEKGISLRLRPGGIAWVCGDQSLLTQMMLNLVENALKYNRPEGQVNVSITQNGEECVLTVADDGVGIEPQNLPRIFERFFRADAARDRSGTGLGLPIVEWIVKMHRGTISVDSEPNKGTQFQVTFPLKDEASPKGTSL